MAIIAFILAAAIWLAVAFVAWIVLRLAAASFHGGAASRVVLAVQWPAWLAIGLAGLALLAVANVPEWAAAFIRRIPVRAAGPPRRPPIRNPQSAIRNGLAAPVRCPACGSLRAHNIDAGHAYNMIECPDCGAMLLYRPSTGQATAMEMPSAAVDRGAAAGS